MKKYFIWSFLSVIASHVLASFQNLVQELVNEKKVCFDDVAIQAGVIAERAESPEQRQLIQDNGEHSCVIYLAAKLLRACEVWEAIVLRHSRNDES